MQNQHNPKNTWRENHHSPFTMGWTTEEPISIAETSSLQGSSKETRSSIGRATQSETDELKSTLRSLLIKHHGSTKDPEIVSVIDRLTELNPCKTKCTQTKEFFGDFCALTCPNFPGRLEVEEGREDLVQYTLGRLSFNIFQPSKLVCTLRSVRNPIELLDKKISIKKVGDKETYSYPLSLDVTIHTPDGDLPALLINEAYCYESQDADNRLMVSFTGGTLVPNTKDGTEAFNEEVWSKTFKGAYAEAKKNQSMFGWMFQFFISLVLGLTMPSDDSFSKHSFHFDMKRSPVGHLDVLYLDDDLRITRGNRGTIVVAERTNKDA